MKALRKRNEIDEMKMSVVMTDEEGEPTVFVEDKHFAGDDTKSIILKALFREIGMNNFKSGHEITIHIENEQ